MACSAYPHGTRSGHGRRRSPRATWTATARSILAIADPHGIYVLFGNGDGTFAAPLEVATAAASDIAVADFDGDGALDLAFAQTGSIGILVHDSARTFSTAGSYGCSSCSRIAVADLDGNGRADIVGVAKAWIDDDLEGSVGVQVLLHR